MTRTRIVSCLLATVLVAAPAFAQNPPNAPRAAADSVAPMPSVTLPPELDRVLRDYERGWRAGDAAALAALFTEDGFVLQGNRAPVRGRAAIQRAYSGGAGAPLHLRALAFATDGALGYIIGAYGYPADNSANAAVPDMGKFTLTLRREGSRWLIFSDMDNSSRPMRRPPAGPPPGSPPGP